MLFWIQFCVVSVPSKAVSFSTNQNTNGVQSTCLITTKFRSMVQQQCPSTRQHRRTDCVSVKLEYQVTRGALTRCSLRTAANVFVRGCDHSITKLNPIFVWYLSLIKQCHFQQNTNGVQSSCLITTKFQSMVQQKGPSTRQHRRTDCVSWCQTGM